MVGWAAVTGSVSVESILLFLIIFMWTPPHFWALALYRMRDYDRVGVPMMPNVAGPGVNQAPDPDLLRTAAPIGIAPWFIGLGGIGLSRDVGLVYGTVFVWYLAWALLPAQFGGLTTASRMPQRESCFGFSILYLYSRCSWCCSLDRSLRIAWVA